MMQEGSVTKLLLIFTVKFNTAFWALLFTMFLHLVCAWYQIDLTVCVWVSACVHVVSLMLQVNMNVNYQY